MNKKQSLLILAGIFAVSGMAVSSVNYHENENNFEQAKHASKKSIDPFDYATSLPIGLTFPANNENYEIVVFWDQSCSWCRRLALEIPEYQKYGITITLLPYSRDGLNSELGQNIMKIWNRPQPLQDVNPNVISLPIKIANKLAKNEFEKVESFAKALKVTSTPTILLKIGDKTEFITGYIPPDILFDYLSNI